MWRHFNFNFWTSHTLKFINLYYHWKQPRVLCRSFWSDLILVSNHLNRNIKCENWRNVSTFKHVTSFNTHSNNSFQSLCNRLKYIGIIFIFYEADSSRRKGTLGIGKWKWNVHSKCNLCANNWCSNSSS